MRTALLTVSLLLMSATSADAAPWRVAGISENQRNLTVVYRGSDCRPGDAVASVAATRERVRIAVHRTRSSPATAFCPLIVRLGERLNRRPVVGGPRLRATPPLERVPRVVGLLKADAREALAGQALTFTGTEEGVVRAQLPGPGEGVTGRVQLALARVGGGARLRIAIEDGQTPESVIAGGLRFSYRVNPELETRLAATLLCDQAPVGSAERTVREADADWRVRVDPEMRYVLRAARVPCSLIVLSYPEDSADMTDYLRSRRDTVVLRRQRA